MIEWAAQNPTLVVIAAIAAVGAAVALLALWLRTARTTRILSAELDRADTLVLTATASAAQQDARMRVIREVQDVAARDIHAIATNAEAAGYLGDGEAATRAAARIADAARIALADLRRLQTIAGDGASGSGPAAALTDLITAREDEGLVVRLREQGRPLELAGAAELALDRIVDDALGNALHRGGPGTEVTLALDWTEDGVRLQIDDDSLLASARRARTSPDARLPGRSVSLSYRAPRRGVPAWNRTAQDDLTALIASTDGADLFAVRARTAAFGGVLSTKQVAGIGYSVAIVFPALRHHNGVQDVPIAR